MYALGYLCRLRGVRHVLVAQFRNAEQRAMDQSSQQLSSHVSVMKDEVVRLLDAQPKQILLDMTFGAGGHTRALLHSVPDLTCFGLDRDCEAVVNVEKLRSILDKPRGTMTPIHGKFSDLPQLCTKYNIEPDSIDLIIMDLGMSSMQLDDDSRGFGIKNDGFLDMRMDGPSSSTPTGAEVVNCLDAADLSQIFKVYGEERFARRIANAVYEHRHVVGPIRTTKQLAQLVNSVVPNWSQSNSLPPATRVFQALRIFINDELNELCVGLEVAHRLLKPASNSQRGGRLAVLSFHSLEDRLVKWAFKMSTAEATSGLASTLSARTLSSAVGMQRRQSLLYELDSTTSLAASPMWKRAIGPIQPTEDEMNTNPRCRSAKLRVAEKS